MEHRPMDHRQIEEYLTHYQPELKAELLRTGQWQTYLQDQANAMQEAKEQLIAHFSRHSPWMSQFQKEREADQTVREMFFSLS